ncbi:MULTISPECIES: MFS transporter [unclassified Streptomyces]|uniref:MFS transporter n=1 Tax=unclassified Streptomyces TaxID=2593676 RepID=UPI00099F3C60|nr:MULTISPECIES: MFS transporter [unclassified Streptomyces]THC48010.1 MFS transporter [Streptomyces sp. A1499]
MPQSTHHTPNKQSRPGKRTRAGQRIRPSGTGRSPVRGGQPERGRLAVLAVAAATFSVVTTEMLPVGLLTSIGSGLGVSDGNAGLAVTLPGVVAALAAPLLPVAVRRADRRTVLCALLVLLAAANLASALAPGFGVLLAARVLVGVCIGGVWAVAAGLGVRLVRAEGAGRATAVIFSGIAVASVLGVPAGTLLGELAGWRWGFAALAVLALGVAALLAVLLPRLPAGEGVRLGAFAGLLRVRRLRAGLIAVTLLVTGHFAAYTYVRPVLERLPGIGAGLVSGLLLAYGTAGIVGNFAGGAVAARDPRRALLAISAGLGAVVLLLVPAGGSLAASGVLLVAWGLAYGGVSVSAQNWVMAAAPHAREAASALFAGVFNVAIALGAFAGGRVADGGGAGAVLWLGGGLSALALIAVAHARDTPADAATAAPQG